MTTKKTINITIVEDDIYFNKILSRYVENICRCAFQEACNFNVQSYHSAHAAIENLSEDLDVVILDYFLRNEDEKDKILTGEDVLQEVHKRSPNAKVIMVSAQQDRKKMAGLIRQGVFKYIDKNINSLSRVGAALKKALGKYCKGSELPKVA